VLLVRVGVDLVKTVGRPSSKRDKWYKAAATLQPPAAHGGPTIFHLGVFFSSDDDEAASKSRAPVGRSLMTGVRVTGLDGRTPRGPPDRGRRSDPGGRAVRCPSVGAV